MRWQLMGGADNNLFAPQIPCPLPRVRGRGSAGARIRSWGQSIAVARKEARLFYVGQAEHLLGQAFQAQAHSAMRGHAMFEGFEIAFAGGGVEAAGFKATDQLLVAIDALPASNDLDPVVEQIEAGGEGRVGRMRHGVGG